MKNEIRIEDFFKHVPKTCSRLAWRAVKKVKDQRRKPFTVFVQWQYASQRAMMTYAIWPKPNHCSGAMRTFVRASNVEWRRNRKGCWARGSCQEKREKKEKVKINRNLPCTWPGDPLGPLKSCAYSLRAVLGSVTRN